MSVFVFRRPWVLLLALRVLSCLLLNIFPLTVLHWLDWRTPRIKVMVLSSPPPRSLGRFPRYHCASSQCHNLDETPENIIVALDDDDNMLDNNNRTTKGRAPPKLWGWPASQILGKSPGTNITGLYLKLQSPLQARLGPRWRYLDT